MISIVVCSVNPTYLSLFEKNVNETIGSKYELLVLNNNILKRGICAIYNEGTKKAAGDIISFCHEDIIFETQNWGKELEKLINEDSSIGLVGTAGAVYKSKYPGSWAAIPYEYYRANMTQRKNDGSHIIHTMHDAGGYSEVVVIDGCFISGRTKIFERYLWNEQLFNGFHCYDLDISIRVGENFKLVTSNNISITHLSEGNFDTAWLKDTQKFHEYYKKKLPVKKAGFRKKKVMEIEYFAWHSYVLTLARLKQSWLYILPVLAKGFISFPFRKQNLSLIKQLFITR